MSSQVARIILKILGVIVLTGVAVLMFGIVGAAIALIGSVILIATETKDSDDKEQEGLH